MKLVTGLVKVSLGVSIQLQTTQKRYDLEFSKRVSDRAPDRLEALKASVSEVTPDPGSSLSSAVVHPCPLRLSRSCERTERSFPP